MTRRRRLLLKASEHGCLGRDPARSGLTIAGDMTEPDEITTASQRLADGGVVAFPTETVYGLGADATNAEAVARVFELKGRPAKNPLIVHVTGEEMARTCVSAWPEAASKAAEVLALAAVHFLDRS